MYFFPQYSKHFLTPRLFMKGCHFDPALDGFLSFCISKPWAFHKRVTGTWVCSGGSLGGCRECLFSTAVILSLVVDYFTISLVLLLLQLPSPLLLLLVLLSLLMMYFFFPYFFFPPISFTGSICFQYTVFSCFKK